MLLTIYDSHNIKKLVVSPDDSSTHTKGIQEDDVLSLSFTSYEYVILEVNDYIDFLGDRFWLQDRYVPIEKNEQEWKYDLKLYGLSSLIKRFLVLNVVGGTPNAVFTLTAPAREHVALIVKSINAGFGTTDWKLGEVVDTENLVIDYEGTYCNEGLETVAKKAGVEFWFAGTTVNLTRCEYGEEVTLGYGKGLLELEPSKADGIKLYTRLFPVGSSRNIDPSKYGYSHLQLPGGIKYVDVNTEKYGIIHHYEQSAFAGIYPKRIGTVSTVRSELVKDKNGANFTIWYFQDQNIDFNPNDYELPREKKRVSFQTGELQGLGTGEDHFFEVNYDDKKKEFEIITIWPEENSTQLPGGMLVPKVGDTYILWNIRMPDSYIHAAEKEFRAAVDRFNEKHAKDVSLYKAPTDYVYIEDKKIQLYPGCKVRLESTKYFPDTGFRNSRIIKVARKVNCPSKMDIEIGDTISTGKMQQVGDKIEEVKNYVKHSSLNQYEIVRSWENTPPSDYNVASFKMLLQQIAKRSLSKLEEDTALGLIRFLDGIEVGEAVDSLSTGKGTVITKDGRIQTDRMEVRGSALFMELVINRLNAVESDFVFTESGHIEHVIAIDGTTFLLQLRKRWKYDFPAFAEHDVAYGSINTLLEDGSYHTSWFRVLHMDKAKAQMTVAIYPDNEVPGGRNFVPVAGMNINRRGNAIHEDRQTCWYISAREGTIMYLMGVTKPILEESNYCAWLGLPKHLELFNGLPVNYKQPYLFARGAIIQDLLRVDYKGNPVYEVVDVGTWLSSGKYIKGKDPESNRYIQHQVWHTSCCWRCVSPQATVGLAPRWNNPQWICIVGSNNYTLAITSTKGRFFRIGQEYTRLGYILKHGDMDITSDAWQVKWERESGLPDEDLLWNIEHANVANALEISPRDMPTNWIDKRKVSFICTVWLKEGETPRTAKYEINK